ncbi:phenylalanine--tRNA ligase subunit alpha [bacterium DOLZORAL124_38_8]|nr:MAG: phenylalanine--tRNA ligase subunit alpha [bacterium DOLZORAL124_38_8]
MTEILQQINQLKDETQQKVQTLKTLDDLQAFQQTFTGKNSLLVQLSKGLKTLPPEEKKTVGQAVGALREFLNNLIEEKASVIKKQALEKQLEAEWIDVTKTNPPKTGAIHPLNQVQRQVETIFSSMGFEIADGPHLETEWNNFDALDIPEHHPARDMQDTFWVNNEAENPHENRVLRTQTSDVQIRMMKEFGAPLRLISPGRVFRNEDVDATHDAVFYQVEGLLIDKDISLAHLKGTITTMLSKLFEKDIKIRLRPGYFPFVEPGFEVDMWFETEGKPGKWLEFMGAGMVHPNVLKNGGIDPNEYTGFAFGFGLTRLAMMKYGITDIRYLLSPKIDFLKQF